jgi:hypothetical protein
MKGALIALFIGITLLILLYVKMDIYKSKGTIYIHLHDTYFVLSYATVILFVLLLLGTFFSVGGIVGSHFKNKLFWILMVFFLSVDTYYIVTFYKLFNDNKATSFPKE